MSSEAIMEKSVPVLLSVPETAGMLKVEEKTLRNWRYQGCGPKYLKLGRGRRGTVVYALADVLLWLGESKAGK